MSEVAIRADHISKAYKLFDSRKDRIREFFGIGHKQYHREHYALRDVSFEVKKGETVGIIGTNGAGKSTMLKIITGVLSPSAGEITVDGRISALLELGAGFNGEYTGMENIYLNGTMIGFSKKEIDEKLEDILSFAEIGEFVHQPVKTYSSGMFVRLAFAVAINIEPEILIVDEALSVGDAFFQVKCYHKFEEFRKQGRTIVFVSHDLSSIKKYCDRVILLDKGTKLDEGSPREMIDLYKKTIAASRGAKQIANAAEELKKKKEEGRSPEESGETGLWREKMEENPECSSYGNGAAQIIDYCVTDQNGMITNVLTAGEEYAIRVKVEFFQPVSDPIMSVTFRDKQGTVICGTNTMYQNVDTGDVEPGEIRVVTFRQKMVLKGGEYLLCLGCTGFPSGIFTVYHRLYETCLIQVVSDQDMVGYFDMCSSVEYIEQ